MWFKSIDAEIQFFIIAVTPVWIVFNRLLLDARYKRFVPTAKPSCRFAGTEDTTLLLKTAERIG